MPQKLRRLAEVLRRGMLYKIGDEKRRCSIKEAFSNRLDAKNRTVETAFFFQFPERSVAREFASIDVTLGQAPSSLVPAVKLSHEENRPGPAHDCCDAQITFHAVHD